MFQLLRRISGTFTRRFEWDQDGHSSDAPRVGSKRRMDDDDDDVVGSLSKRSRKLGDAQEEGSEGTSSVPATPLLGPSSGKETEDVREVTKGVKEVELEDNGLGEATSEEAATDEQTPATDESSSAPPAEEDTVADGEVKQNPAVDKTSEEEEEEENDSPSPEDAPKGEAEDLPTSEESEKPSAEEATHPEDLPSGDVATSASDTAQITSDEGTVTSESLQLEAISPPAETAAKQQ